MSVSDPLESVTNTHWGARILPGWNEAVEAIRLRAIAGSPETELVRQANEALATYLEFYPIRTEELVP